MACSVKLEFCCVEIKKENNTTDIVNSRKISHKATIFFVSYTMAIVYHLIGKWCVFAISLHLDSISLKHTYKHEERIEERKREWKRGRQTERESESGRAS